MSPVVDATSRVSEQERATAVEAAVEAVRAGQVVVIPTDTVYGIGCDAFSPESVAAVLAAKGRGRDMPPPVLVAEQRTVDGLARGVPPWARDLLDRFWPGPLTLVLPAQPSLHWDLGETAGTVALRMPDDEVTLEILRAIGPMAVTSANRTGRPPATTVMEAATQLGAAVEVYVDAGPRSEARPSTILDCTGEHPVVLREGALSLAEIREVLGETTLGGPAGQEGTTEEATGVEVPPSSWAEDPSSPEDEMDPEVVAAEAARLHAPRHGAGEDLTEAPDADPDDDPDWQDRPDPTAPDPTAPHPEDTPR